VDCAWEQEKLEARKMLVNRAESTASSVSMQGQPTGCSRARFWICSVCSENGNAYPGTLREGPVETCMGNPVKILDKPAPVCD
jgi:hypothetical protein